MRSFEVVIPVYNPDKKLYELLKRMLKQQLKPKQIHIFLTLTPKYSELDFINGLAKAGIKDSSIIVTAIEKSSFNHGLTRQAGAEECESDLCLFMTQDAVPYDSHLTVNLVSEFEKDDIAVTYARQIPYKSASVKEKFARSFNYPENPEVKDRSMLDAGKIKALFCSDVCAMYDMKVFKALGGFEKTDFNEDMLFVNKALTSGYRISYCSEAKVYHSHNLTYKEQFKRNKDIACSQKQHNEIFGKLNSEGEGLSYVKNGLKYILKNGNIIDAADFVTDCGFRFLGFKIGKMF